MNQTAVIILSVTAAINLTAITVFSWIKAVKHRAYVWLGALLGASTLAIIDNLFIFLGYDKTWLYHLSMVTNLSWGAFLIGFFRHLTRPHPVGNVIKVWYFLPSLLYMVYLVASLFHPIWPENTLTLARSGRMTAAATLFNYSICLYALGANTLLLISTYRNTLIDVSGLSCCKEARQLLWPMLLLQLGAFIPFIARMDITYIITYMPLFGQLYFLYLFFRLSNPQLMLLLSNQPSTSRVDSPSKNPDPKQHKYANLRLSEAKIAEVATAIENEMLVHKPYLRLNYSLHDLSEQLQIPSYILSMVINSRWNLRFTDFINKYRVIQAKEALCSQEKRQKTIEAIALDSGFSNRTSFYQAFKKETGMLPNEYVKKPASSKKKAGGQKNSIA